MFGLSLYEIVLTLALIVVVWLFYKRVGGMYGWRRKLGAAGWRRVRRTRGRADAEGGTERRRTEDTSSTNEDVINMVRTQGSDTYVPVRKRRRRSDRRG